MKSTVNQSMQSVMQAMVSGNQQIAEALQAVAQTNEKILQAMTAPRKRVKDKSGKTIGVEIQGFGNVPVQ